MHQEVAAMLNWPCTLCGSRDWPSDDSSCPLCRTQEEEEEEENTDHEDTDHEI